MGKYLSPASPISYSQKCAVIIYPHDDNGFFLHAVRGQLSALARPFIWEGDREQTDEIAQIFTITDLATDDVFFGLDCDLLPLILGDEPMNINVNCNCGCTGGETATIYCYGSDGEPQLTPQLPQEPVPPTPDGYEFPVDPEVDEPPDGSSTWEEYDIGICLAANWMWLTARAILVTAETLADVATTLVALVVVIVPLLPASWVAAASGWTMMEALRMLVRLFASEQATDIINEIVAWLDNEKDEIICTIYSHRYDWRGIPAGLIIAAQNYIELSLTLDEEEQNAVQSLINYLFFWTIFVAVGIEHTVDLTGVTIPEPYDCELCELNENIVFAAGNKGSGSTFDVQSQTPNSCHAEGYLAQYGAGNYIWGWIGTTLSVETLFPTVAAHGIEFVLDEYSSSDPTGPALKVLDDTLISDARNKTGYRFVCHDGTLPESGYDEAIVMTPSSWGPAFDSNQIGSAILSTNGTDSNEPAGDYTIKISDFYWLDEFGNRMF